jgi:hypothetical protein
MVRKRRGIRGVPVRIFRVKYSMYGAKKVSDLGGRHNPLGVHEAFVHGRSQESVPSDQRSTIVEDNFMIEKSNVLNLFNLENRLYLYL